MSSVSRVLSGRTFNTIILQTNCYNQVLSPTHAKVTVPGGFPYEAYNGKACIRPWSVMRMIECSRAAAYIKPDDGSGGFIDAAELHDHCLFFMASTTASISPKLYEISTKKAPLEIDVTLDNVGNSTYKLKTLLLDPDASIPLCTHHAQFVCVNKETRRPTLLPKWWKDKYSNAEGQPLKIPHLGIPENVKLMKHSFQAQASDTDPYMHVNWTNYLKYCHDAFFLTEYKKNPDTDAERLFRGMKEFSVRYIKEASLGDNIHIQFWESPVNNNFYCFQLMKESEVICECSAEFFPKAGDLNINTNSKI